MTLEEMNEMLEHLKDRPKFKLIADSIERGDLAEAILRLAMILDDFGWLE